MMLRRINLSLLSPERKRAAWDWLQKNRPAEAALIQQDDVQKALKVFDGSIILEIDTDEKN